MKKIRVLIVDDHGILRAGLRTFLNLQPDMEVVGEAAEGLEAVEKVKRLEPDVVLMDISLPGMEGLEVAKKLKKTHPDVKVLILTMHEDRRYLYSALKAGASGYVVKRAADTELIDAIRAAYRGDVFLHPSMAKIVAEDYVEQAGMERGLSDREREVLRLIAEGRTYKEMAKLLAVSVKTIETYRERIKEKLGLHTRAELVRYALEKGLVGPRR
ncbi:MAG: DNA-binding response regulator [Deltaproteobacteria bacterium RIFCSPLOWO2_12_55_13]|nr:MAG: DNA-binding response regulator [Deltaproteobacteria bacterium GWD2_55_8]OGQ61873.1 MAG: DNA-binding response regulator [Deltaproteobacteria bacterium RIFCSPLOWO2_12_55_13]HBA40420.1 DNA-binding response regulator [Deltaproteobacteria bacterium]